MDLKETPAHAKAIQIGERLKKSEQEFRNPQK